MDNNNKYCAGIQSHKKVALPSKNYWNSETCSFIYAVGLTSNSEHETRGFQVGMGKKTKQPQLLVRKKMTRMCQWQVFLVAQLCPITLIIQTRNGPACSCTHGEEKQFQRRRKIDGTHRRNAGHMCPNPRSAEDFRNKRTEATPKGANCSFAVRTKRPIWNLPEGSGTKFYRFTRQRWTWRRPEWCCQTQRRWCHGFHWDRLTDGMM